MGAKRWACAGLIAAGCGRVAFDPRADGGAGGADMPGEAPDVASLACDGPLATTFDALPAGFTNYGNATVTIAGGELDVAVNGVQGVEGGLRSPRFSLVGRAIALRVAKRMVGRGSTAIGIHLFDHSDMFHVYAYDDELGFERDGPTGYEDLGTKPYDDVMFRWWRVSELAGMFRVETAPDGQTWTLRFEVPMPFDATDVTFDVSSGVPTNSIPADNSRFDDLLDCALL